MACAKMSPMQETLKAGVRLNLWDGSIRLTFLLTVIMVMMMRVVQVIMMIIIMMRCWGLDHTNDFSNKPASALKRRQKRMLSKTVSKWESFENASVWKCSSSYVDRWKRSLVRAPYCVVSVSALRRFSVNDRRKRMKKSAFLIWADRWKQSKKLVWA